MVDIPIKSLTLGLNSTVSANELNARAAADGTQNVDFDVTMVSSFGFAKFDCASPLVAGQNVFAMFQHVDEFTGKHFLVLTDTSLLRHDIVNNEWNVLAATFNCDPYNPVSFITVPHQDVIGTNYTHCVASDGGKTDIKRWALDGDTVEALTGGCGYNLGGVSGHRAKQVVLFQNRLILVSPYECTAGGIWLLQSNRIRWPQVARLERQVAKAITAFADGTGGTVIVTSAGHGFADGGSVIIAGTTSYNGTFIVSSSADDTFKITATWVANDATGTVALSAWEGTGSGFQDLLDTGDENVRGELLGTVLVIYQKHSIWQIRYVGGTTVFYPDPLIKDLGLLGFEAFVSIGTSHYIVANDYNVYRYSGGTMLENIGKGISEFIKRDMDAIYSSRVILSISPQNKFLWVFIVSSGCQYCTIAYKINTKTGAWTKVDLSGHYTTGGVLCSELIGAGVYTIGESYRTAVALAPSYGAALCTGTEITKTETTTATVWSGSGAIMTNDGSGVGEAATWKTPGASLVSPDDIVHIVSGTHVTAGYYRVASVTSDTVMALDSSIESGGTASNVVYTLHKNDSESYGDVLDEIRVNDSLFVGDTAGYVLKQSDSLYTFDGTILTQIYTSPEFDLLEPHKMKLWPGIVVDARGSSMLVEVRLDDGDWTTYGTLTLTDKYTTYNVYIHQSSKKMQYRLRNASGTKMDVRSATIMSPVVEGSR